MIKLSYFKIDRKLKLYKKYFIYMKKVRIKKL